MLLLTRKEDSRELLAAETLTTCLRRIRCSSITCGETY
jgi:hypothetical protein